jgi:hypothetical protein
MKKCQTNVLKYIDMEQLFVYNQYRTAVLKYNIFNIRVMLMRKEMKKKKYVLKKKGRLVTLVVSLIIVISTILIASNVYSYEKPEYIEITIAAGDTLWDIAREYQEKGDIRRYIFDIKKLNKMSDSRIYEGQKIIIPK